VCTDFSIKSHNALVLAKRIAIKAKSTIHIVHVLEPILGNYFFSGEFVKDPMDDVFMIRIAEKVTAELHTLEISNMHPNFDIKVKLLIGDPYQKIKNLTEELNADLVVMGYKGVTNAEDFFLGSLTDKVIRSLQCPVLTVKEVMDERSFDNIVYATDLEEDHTAMMNLILRFQDIFGSTVHIVKMNNKNNFKNEMETKAVLQRLVDKYDMKNYTINCYSHEDEEYGVVHFADEVGADLIVMGVHEKSGFRRLISGGSIADEVTDHTFRPVLTYRFQTVK
jgi:nucleotide-binding universal stress UspA family protein